MVTTYGTTYLTHSTPVIDDQTRNVRGSSETTFAQLIEGEGSHGVYHRDFELHPLPPEPPVRDEGSLGGYHREIGEGSGESSSGSINGGIGIVETGEGEGDLGGYHRDDPRLIGPPEEGDLGGYHRDDPRLIGPPEEGDLGGYHRDLDLGSVLETYDALQGVIDAFIQDTTTIVNTINAAPAPAAADFGVYLPVFGPVQTEEV